PSEDPYEEAARQLLEHAPHSPEYVPDPIELEDHGPVYIREPEHPKDLVPAEDEAPTPQLPPSFLSPQRLAYEQESMETRQALVRSEAYCRALEARVTVLETEVPRHEWQCQAADDFVVWHIMRIQALEAGARVDTLEDTGSSS
ncbi:hypothetical protein Tco_1527025, partial [Tanacetum coccineum]